MSPGMWHWSCCCGGEGVGVGYLFAQHYNTRKPVVVTITNGGDISYDALNPTDFDAASNTGAYPASTTSGEIVFLYQGASRRIYAGSLTMPGGVWGYGAADIDGGNFTADAAFSYRSRIHLASDGTVRGHLPYDSAGSPPPHREAESTTSAMVYTDLGAHPAGTSGYGFWALDTDTWARWVTYNKALAAPVRSVAQMWKFGEAAGEDIETFDADHPLLAVGACSMLNGKVGSLWQWYDGTEAAPRRYRLRLYVRTGAATYQTVDMPEDAVKYSGHAFGHSMCSADIDGTEVLLIAISRIVYDGATPDYIDYMYYVVNTDTWAVTASRVVTEAPYPGPYMHITTTTENIPCMAVAGAADGDQLTFYLGSGSSWTPYTTTLAGGFYQYGLSVAWQPYLGL